MVIRGVGELWRVSWSAVGAFTASIEVDPRLPFANVPYPL